MGKVSSILRLSHGTHGSGGGAEAVWQVGAGLGGPHDFALGAAPMPAHGTGDRALAVYFAETRPQFSLLRKFIFVPEGQLLPAICSKHPLDESTPELSLLEFSAGLHLMHVSHRCLCQEPAHDHSLSSWQVSWFLSCCC